MALKNNLLDPLISKWKFIQIEKVGRRHNISLTEDGMNALTFLSAATAATITT
jgi:predicted transcriptional regulator